MLELIAICNQRLKRLTDADAKLFEFQSWFNLCDRVSCDIYGSSTAIKDQDVLIRLEWSVDEVDLNFKKNREANLDGIQGIRARS